MEDKFFLPYQVAWIRDESRIKLMEKSRQIGMSWTTAYALVRRHCAGLSRRDTWVSSRDELQAKLFIDDCRKFSDILGIAISEVSNSRVDSSADARSIGFADGTRIWSLSSNPDAQAGKRGTRVLDEFALHPDPALLYAVAYPGITWGGSLQIISTHRGTDNFFYKLVDEARNGGNPKNISLHRVTLQDALEQGLLGKIKAALPPEHEVSHMDEAEYFDLVKKSCADEESFLQEYMCCPADDASAFISYDSMNRCLYKEGVDWECFEGAGNPLFLGIDVGRSRDLSVFWLLERVGDVLYTRRVLAISDTPFSEQEAELENFLRLPNLRRVAIDQSGLGRQFAERAIARYGSGRVEGVSFTQGVKEELAYPLRSRFEDALLRIPDDPEVRADIRAVKKMSTRSGGIRFCAPRSSDGHSDRFWALALANYAARESLCGTGKMDIVEAVARDFVW